MTSTSDSTFLALPQYLRRRIDRAFDAAVIENGSTSRGPSSKKGGEIDAFTGVDSAGGGFVREPALAGLGVGGGFLVDDSDPTSRNGFMVEEDGNDVIDIQSHIHMSSIPSALQLLDLPPDDDQVLSVFRNAASGWSSSSSYSLEGNADDGGMVSKEDWRAVCAVLLEHHAEEYEDSEDGGGTGYAGHETSEADATSDEYHDPYAASDDSNGGSDDEYVEGPSTSPYRRRSAAHRNKSTSGVPGSSPSLPKKLTPRQTQTCLQAFALFFPSVAASELPNQKIMIKDIQRVAKVLGEKIKADEMIEMLEAFSTSPDKSMSLTDFERMMVSAKLA